MRRTILPNFILIGFERMDVAPARRSTIMNENKMSSEEISS